MRTASKPRLVIPPTAEALAIETHARSVDGLALAMAKVANEIKLTREQSRPMHDFYEGASDALMCMRKRTAKWGPWLLALTPLVIIVINGSNPSAAKLIGWIVGHVL